jgi:hypothetical protein
VTNHNGVAGEYERPVKSVLVRLKSTGPARDRAGLVRSPRPPPSAADRLRWTERPIAQGPRRVRASPSATRFPRGGPSPSNGGPTRPRPTPTPEPIGCTPVSAEIPRRDSWTSAQPGLAGALHIGRPRLQRYHMRVHRAQLTPSSKEHNPLVTPYQSSLVASIVSSQPWLRG